MHVKFFCPRWGSEQIDISEFAKKVKDHGYDGIEMSLPLEQEEKDKILECIAQNELEYIAQHWEAMGNDFTRHKEELQERLENLASAHPLFINSHTGKDYFSFEQNAELIEMASKIAANHKLSIVHETHRSRFGFAAHIAAEYLNKIPDLRLTFDASHWCAVAESYLQDQKENVELAIDRADHIHARIGFPQGPQIPDPRATEWKEAFDIHMDWWKKIITKRKVEGKEVMTICAEFGPYPYMINLPNTNQPIANQWDINVFMMNTLRKEFN